MNAEETPPADAVPASPAGTGDGAKGPGGPAEEEHPENIVFAKGTRNPLADEEEPDAGRGAARATQQARHIYSGSGPVQVYDGAYITGGVSNDHSTHVNLRTGAGLLAGPISTEELKEVDRLHRRPPGYEDMLRGLEERRLVVLCGEPGSGRRYTALALLRERIQGTIAQIDETAELASLDDEELGIRIGDACGFVWEPARESERLGTMHLDRLRAVLENRKSYGAILVSGAAAAELLPASRYAHLCLPPPFDEVLAARLEVLLPDLPSEARDEARAVAHRPDVVEALGVGDLRPYEAVRLAGLLAARAGRFPHRAARSPSGSWPDEGPLAHEKSDPAGPLDGHPGLAGSVARRSPREQPDTGLAELLDACGTFATDQVMAWFAGVDRDAAPASPEVRAAAFRVALSVFHQGSYSLAAEASERLAREFATEIDPDPESVVGRPLFDHDEARLLLARASVGRGEDLVGSALAPVQTVRFQGARLPIAVLVHVWHTYHNFRRPMVRWLDELGNDLRPVVWTRAAVAAGLLATLDFGHSYHSLILPAAASARPRRRMFAALALDQAANADAVKPAARAVVQEWSRSGGKHLRWTAAAAAGYGQVTDTAVEALDMIGRIGGDPDDEGDLTAIAASAVVTLAASAPLEALQRIGAWIDDSRTERNALALVAIIRLVSARVADVPHDEDGRDTWPLVLQLAGRGRAEAGTLADLIAYALGHQVSHQATLAAVGGWIRAATDDETQQEALLRFVPRLVGGADDRNRLLHLLRSLVQDPDEPVPAELARLMARALDKEER